MINIKFINEKKKKFFKAQHFIPSTLRVNGGVWWYYTGNMRSENHNGWWGKPRSNELSFLIVYAAAFYAFIIHRSLQLSRGSPSYPLSLSNYDDNLILLLSIFNWFYFWDYKQLITPNYLVCVLDGWYLIPSMYVFYSSSFKLRTCPFNSQNFLLICVTWYYLNMPFWSQLV